MYASTPEKRTLHRRKWQLKSFSYASENAKDSQNESQTKVFDPLSAVRVIHENTNFFFRQPPPKNVFDGERNVSKF